MKVLYPILLLISFPVFSRPCGLSGSIEERIKDCNQTKGTFSLVTMTDNGIETYKDMKTGLIWGSRILTDFNHYGSQKACSDDVSGYQSLNSLKWRLPTIREFETAAANGMKAALQNTQHSYWSSTGVSTKRSRKRRAPPAQVFLWDGFLEKTDTGDLKDAASVRCVSKE